MAASNIHAIGAENFARNLRQRGGASSLTELGPISPSRRLASALVRPIAAACFMSGNAQLSLKNGTKLMSAIAPILFDFAQ
jgi:hypothetical protein